MPSQTNESPDRFLRRRPLRVWPALLITLLAAARATQIWLFRDYDVQFKVEGTHGLLRHWVVGMAIWWLLFSRIRWQSRLKGVVVLGLVAGLISLFVRVHGIDGNRIPILEWRWSSRASSAASVPRGSSSNPNGIESATRPVGNSPAVRPEASFPQFLGPSRNGILPGPALFEDWTKRPPELIWRQPVGEGWSGFAVQGSDAVSLEQDGDNEVIVCRELTTGNVRWRQAYPARYDNPSAGTGPRTVASIEGDFIWTTGATGMLTCTDRRDGRVVWQHNCLKDANAAVPEWGFSGSPLIHGNWVIVPSGGVNGKSLTAYDKRSGAIVWSSGNDVTGYSSPVLVTLGGTRQILSFSHAGITGYSASDGRQLWWRATAQIPNVAVPLAVDDSHVLISSGYGFGAELLEVKPNAAGVWSASQTWRSIRMKSKFANLILREGHAYGFDDGTFACIRLSDGSKAWKDGRYGHGQVLQVGNLLLATTESGEIVLIDPSPEGLRERTRFRVLTGKTWNPPALAGDLLLVRHDREAACFRLPIQ